MPPSLRTELIDVAHATPRTLAAWRDLGARAVEPNPWFEPELLLPLRRHLIPGLMLVVAERAGEMIGCMPLKPNPGRRLPMFAAGWGVPHPLGTPLLDPSYLEPALRTMLDAITKLTPQLYVSWRGIGADGPVMPVLREVLAAAAPRRLRRADGTWPIMRQRSAPADLDGPPADPRGRDLEASRRLLGETLGHPLTIRDCSGEGTAADRFLAVEASSEKRRLGTATVQLPGAAEYFREVCQGFGALGRLRTLALEAGTATIAMKCEMSAGKGLFELKAAEDERFRQYSPRALLEIDAGRMFHDGRHDWAVSTALDDESPLHWLWPDRRSWTDIYFWLAGPARAAWRVTTSLARHLVGKGSG